MKWFKHSTTKRLSNDLVLLMDQFGYHKGYACYFLLIEFCAERYELEEKIVIHERTLRQLLNLSSRKIMEFLNYCQELDIFKFQKNDKTFIFYWDELIDIADEYSRKVRRNSASKFGQAPDVLPIHSRNKKENKRLEANQNFFTDLLKTLEDC